jgi:uncharacterized membrane protein
MKEVVEDFAWRFGGPLGELPSRAAWGALAAVAAVGLVWIALSYAKTLVALSRIQRITLTVFRLALLVVIFAALAGPERRARTFGTQEPRPLAVLVDASESMSVPDNRRQRRADDAQRRWLSAEPAAREAFSRVESFVFAEGVKPLAAGEKETGLPTGRTDLFAALQHVLAHAPAGGWGGIVTLTDGLDTSGTPVAEGVDAAARAALGAGTPLYFVPGRNRYAGNSYLTLRDWSVPPQVPPKSTFRLEVTIDTFQTAARTVPLHVRVGEKWRQPEVLSLGAGRRMQVWSTEIAANETGMLPVELRLGDGEGAATARTEVKVARAGNTRVLYYQGALDWGYRFLADILRRDPAFSITPILRVAPAQANARVRATTVSTLPDSMEGYAAHDVVVLANAAASQFTAAQQNALTQWVRDGGVLLFLAPDDDSTRGYAGSELEKMLPVIFARGEDEGAKNSTAESNLRERLRAARNRASTRVGAGGMDVAELVAFEWEPSARQIFSEGKDAPAAPRFMNYAHVLRAKPGAEVLARHPKDMSPKGGDGGRAILLAIQRYGRGQSAVLTSDALWRWKLSQPSTERGVEKFWQNLFAWLARERIRNLHFDRAPLSAELGQEMVLRLVGVGTTAPRVTVASSAGASRETLAAATQEEDARTYRWTPAAAGEWEVTATDDQGTSTRHWLRVSAGAKVGEHSGLPPDEATLSKLAERTGGALLEEGAPASWRAGTPEGEGEALSEQRRPLWHDRWILGAMIGLYGLELILRRRWRLL